MLTPIRQLTITFQRNPLPSLAGCKIRVIVRDFCAKDSLYEIHDFLSYEFGYECVLILLENGGDQATKWRNQGILVSSLYRRSR